MRTRELTALCFLACAGCFKEAPADVPDAGSPVVFRCDTPDSITPLPFGTIVGMDATKLFVRGPDGVLRTWIKDGGPLVELGAQDLPARLVVSGSRYHWWNVGATSLVITDESGGQVAAAQLSAPTSVLVEVDAAPDEGVFIHSQCQQNGVACTPALESIELLRKGSTVAETLATSSYPIHGIAAAGDALIWKEHVDTYEVSIRKWQRSTGSTTTLVDSIEGSYVGREAIAAKAPDFYISLGGVLQQRSLETGVLLATYAGGSGQPVEHLRVTDRAYWTEPPGVLTGPFCVPKRGLVMMQFANEPQRMIDVDAHDEPFFVDDSRVFYSSGAPTCCWSAGTVTCGPSSHELRCYHR